SKEKNINLNVALKVGELIRKNCENVKIIFTRQTDVFVPLDDRADIANKAKADLFISIHTNALPGGKEGSGSETYSLGMARAKENLDVAKRENSVILYEKNYQERYAGFNPNSSESYIIFDYMQDQHMKQSAELAKAIQNQYQNSGRPNKGVHQAGFLVLRKTSMPSVLTELGFITTPQEEQYLNSAKGVDELAHDIYLGFVDYYNVQQRHKSVVLALADQQKDEQQSNNSSNDDNNKEKAQVASEETKQNIPSNRENREETLNQTESKNNATAPIKTPDDNLPPIFKIQIYTSSRSLREGSGQFKGLTKVDHYMDKNIYKYTYGSTASYSEITTLKKTIIEKFPDCFIVAFRGNDKISIQDALSIQKKMFANH
ncbi:MAG: N-acetylmuramoyl-L-alanine amidase, partial [Bacteroidaceae bacterium]|nr:N-acetylmuramoyl-L-alanine amidase [Bacteroidaceae bacterium]